MKRSHCPRLLTLNEKNPIESQLSDHQVLLSGGVLFFNMMMQGRFNREKNRYNNGFALIESNEMYQERIKQTVRSLAEFVSINPQIFAIGLAEAPIRSEDIALFIREAKYYPSLRRFIESMGAEAFTTMGIASFFDTDNFYVERETMDYSLVQPSLRDRFQRAWLMEKATGEERMVVTLHLPYDIAKSKNIQPLLNFVANLFEGENGAIVMGDFNIDPDILSGHFPGLQFDAFNRSNVLLDIDRGSGKILGNKPDCVDAVFRNSPKLREASINELTSAKMLGFMERSAELGFFRCNKKRIKSRDYPQGTRPSHTGFPSCSSLARDGSPPVRTTLLS